MFAVSNSTYNRDLRHLKCKQCDQYKVANYLKVAQKRFH